MDKMPIEDLGLAVLIGVGAIVIGYIVRIIVPNKHFPWTAGLLATNAVVAGFAYAGVQAAGLMLVWWPMVSISVGAFTLIADFELKSKSATSSASRKNT